MFWIIFAKNTGRLILSITQSVRTEPSLKQTDFKLHDGTNKAIIDVTFQEYDRSWATKQYLRPSIGALATWIPNKALAVIQAKDKEQAEIKKAMETPMPTAEEILARLRRGLK